MSTMDTINVVPGITWEEMIENADLLKADINYEYEKDSENLIPIQDYPSGPVHLGTCCNADCRSYDYNVILLGEYSGDWDGFYTEDGSWCYGSDYSRVVYGFALFLDDGSYTLVKATDIVDDSLPYIWLPVAVEAEPGR